MIQTSKQGFKSIELKVANMRGKAQDFIIYPYNGGDTIKLQSSKRIMNVNLKTGKAIINAKNEQNGAYFHHLSFNAIEFDMQKEVVTALQEMLWNNEGKDGGKQGLVSWKNAELFIN